MKTRFSYILSGLAVLLLSGCQEKEWTYENKLFLSGDSMVSNTVLKSSLSSLEKTVVSAVARPEEKDITITYSSDESLVETYSAIYKEDAVIMPAENYTISAMSAKLPAGNVESEPVTISFSRLNELPLDRTFVLPFSIVSADNIGVLDSKRTSYFVFKGGSLINVAADMEDKNYISIPSIENGSKSAEILNGLTDYTLEALICGNRFDPGIQSIMGIERVFLIRISDNGLDPNQLQIVTPMGNITHASNMHLTPGKWTHIAVTADSQTKTFSVYLDGVLAASQTYSTWSTIDLGKPNTQSDKGYQYFHIGYSYEAGREFNGMFSECRVWNVVRTQEEIVTYQYEVDPESEGLIAYWKFDEGRGETITDRTGNGNDGQAHESLTWVPVSLPAVGE